MTTVQLQKISKTFGGMSVLDGLELEAPSGQYLVLLGESGCGKTTALKIIAGLQSPDEGSVRFDGQPIDDVAPRDRDVAMVFQNDGLYPHLTIADSIRFSLRGKVDAAEMQRRVNEATDLTRIDDLLSRHPSDLSGGELRRAALAKAIARRSSVRLLDEPLSALDAPVRYELQDVLLQWHAAVEGTSIHVTHDGQEAMRMADQIGVMDGGKIVQCCKPLELYARPATIAVAKSVGSPPINLFHARTAGARIEPRDPQVQCGIEWDSGSEQERDVVIGVRPDAFALVSNETDSDAATSCGVEVTARVVHLANVHEGIHMQVQTEVETFTVVLISADPALSVGQTLRLHATRSTVLLFDAEDGRRLECD